MTQHHVQWSNRHAFDVAKLLDQSLDGRTADALSRVAYHAVQDAPDAPTYPDAVAAGERAYTSARAALADWTATPRGFEDPQHAMASALQSAVYNAVNAARVDL